MLKKFQLQTGHFRTRSPWIESGNLLPPSLLWLTEEDPPCEPASRGPTASTFLSQASQRLLSEQTLQGSSCILRWSLLLSLITLAYVIGPGSLVYHFIRVFHHREHRQCNHMHRGMHSAMKIKPPNSLFATALLKSGCCLRDGFGARIKIPISPQELHSQSSENHSRAVKRCLYLRSSAFFCMEVSGQGNAGPGLHGEGPSLPEDISPVGGKFQNWHVSKLLVLPSMSISNS